ncbi:MAG: hypothetical protein ABS70_03340 [Nitrospira sp. SCN 59-13]|nr:MAG: hypothetical protein ABS70_03340 [Nitrospira sp. SCN 59-13]
MASQPEPDLEFTEDDLDEAVPPPAPPMNAPKRSKKGPLLWILLLLLVGGIGYVAMDPDAAMQLIQPYLDGGTETSQSVAQRPPAPAPKPAAPPAQAPAPTPAPAVAPPAVVDSAPLAPVEAPAPVPAPVTTAPVPAPAPAMKPAEKPVRIAGPLYAEGQRVMVIADPSRPKSPMPLFADSVGTKTSTTVPASTTLTILDGEYQKNGWVYAVRTQDGRKGWIPERSLRLKR